MCSLCSCMSYHGYIMHYNESGFPSSLLSNTCKWLHLPKWLFVVQKNPQNHPCKQCFFAHIGEAKRVNEKQIHKPPPSKHGKQMWLNNSLPMRVTHLAACRTKIKPPSNSPQGASLNLSPASFFDVLVAQWHVGRRPARDAPSKHRPRTTVIHFFPRTAGQKLSLPPPQRPLLSDTAG